MLKIDKDKCIGCGTCVALAPDIFEMDEENKAVVKTTEFDEENANMAIDSCPTQAILVEK